MGQSFKGWDQVAPSLSANGNGYSREAEGRMQQLILVAWVVGCCRNQMAEGRHCVFWSQFWWIDRGKNLQDYWCISIMMDLNRQKPTCPKISTALCLTHLLSSVKRRFAWGRSVCALVSAYIEWAKNGVKLLQIKASPPGLKQCQGESVSLTS